MRPVLQRLLTDINAGRIDIVVVYKVDRLSRSLFDFSKLVETMDKAGTSFVSVTQSFNTTTSMGRLTLNMLLSFAQFEREVTAERIRDKIAASKAMGMWMGGTPPLGYAPDGRTLKIVEQHAELIRDIFRRYLAIGNVRLLKEQLDDESTLVPKRTTGTGSSMGGVRFTRGQLYKILSSPIYLGELVDKTNWRRKRSVANCSPLPCSLFSLLCRESTGKLQFSELFRPVAKAAKPQQTAVPLGKFPARLTGNFIP